MDKRQELFEEIRDHEDIINFRKRRILELSGFKPSCMYPDSVWRWEREKDGRTLALSEDSALRIVENEIEWVNMDDD